MSGNSYCYSNSINNSKTTFGTIKAPINTKGTLYINNGTEVAYQSSGSNGQYLVTDSLSPLKVKWVDPPSGVTTDATTILVASIQSGSNSTRYSNFDSKTSQQWSNNACEGLIIGFNAKIIAVSICVAENATWVIASGKTIIFTLGKLLGGGDITVTGTFTDYTGTGVSTTVTSANNGTRNIILTTCDINVIATDQIAVKSVDDGTGASGIYYTVAIWIHSTLN